MDFIIGREESTMGGGGRLKIRSVQTKREYYVGHVGSVPYTVSHEHCLLSVNPQTGETNLKNMNLKNSTWVNKVEILTQRVKPEDKIALGCEKFPISLNEILATIGEEIPTTYDISHLEKVWQQYHDKKMELQIRERRNSNMRSITAVLSPIAMVCAFVPVPGVQDAANTIRMVLFIIMGVLAFGFFIYGQKNASGYLRKLDDLEKQFHKDYVCPNPSCQRFMGAIPYEDLIKSSRSCHVCRCGYSHR